MTSTPTISPTISPTPEPTPRPTNSPSRNPSVTPTNPPTNIPTSSPTSCDDPCDAFQINMIRNTTDIFVSTATEYQYEIVRLSNDGICAGNIVTLVLGVCDNDNVNIIFDNVLTYSPMVVGSVNVLLTKLNTTANPFGIEGISLNIPIANNLILTLILDNTDNQILSQSVAFSRNGDNYSCIGDGLPCL